MRGYARCSRLYLFMRNDYVLAGEIGVMKGKNRPRCGNASCSAERRSYSRYCNFHFGRIECARRHEDHNADRIQSAFPSARNTHVLLDRYGRNNESPPPPSPPTRKSLLFSARRQYEFITLSIRASVYVHAAIACKEHSPVSSILFSSARSSVNLESIVSCRLKFYYGDRCDRESNRT